MSKTYNTEIISVGTEILLGHIVNTDARDVSEELSKIGINVKYHTVVGDNPERLRSCIEIAKKRADIIFTTGGLGPTCDDLTKSILAESFGLKLIKNEEEYKGLYEYINTGRHDLTENTYNQAWLPENCTVFHNNAGTAPGCAFEKDGIIVIMVPGPPKECRAMLHDSVIPYLKSLSDETIVSHAVRIFGIGESGVDDIFRDEMNEMVNPTMAPYAKECDCLLQITAKAKSEEEAEKMIRPVMEHVIETLGDNVYGIDLEHIEEAAKEAMSKNGKTFSVSDSYTGGAITSRFAMLPSWSDYLKGAVIKSGSKNLCNDAENVRKQFDSDIGVAVSSDGRIIYLAISDKNGTFEKSYDRGINRTVSFMHTMAGNHVFDEIRRYLCTK